MRFISFEIENFRGVKKAVLDFSKIPHANVFTLVGLNESGKTTILEAINSFSPDREGVESLYGDVFKSIRVQDLVPKDKKGNFSGDIVVRAKLAFDAVDKARLAQFFIDRFKAELDISKIPDVLSIERTHTFKNSNHEETQVLWDLDIFLKKSKQGKFRDYSNVSPEWIQGTDFITEMIPKICYFPTFLFGFPERIYLSNAPKDSGVNAYYAQIIQDVLDSIGGDLDIQTHIVDRVEKNEPNSVWNWYGFLKTDEKQQVDHVMLQIANKITDVIFSRWNEVFGVKLQNKSIDVEWAVEVAQSDPTKRAVYLKFWIKDGQSKFDIAERSLGFRWFFCFLLFTQFRVSRRDSAAVFLFDEPASNLHSKGQEQLLSSFSTISHGDNMIIYSTHSHYMIEPKWLEGSFIVFNDAVDYETDPSSETSQRNPATNIHVKKYREFVAENPNKVTYFQPILDKLDYAPAKLELGLNGVFVEGKNDFYVLEYFREIVFQGRWNYRLLPSSGANDLGLLISLYLGWGRKFLALMDDDEAGRNAAERYRSEWLLSEESVTTIGEFDSNLKGKALEKILSPDALSTIAKEIGTSRPTKKEIARFFQEKFAQREIVAFDNKTLSIVENLLQGCANRFK